MILHSADEEEQDQDAFIGKEVAEHPKRVGRRREEQLQWRRSGSAEQEEHRGVEAAAANDVCFFTQVCCYLQLVLSLKFSICLYFFYSRGRASKNANFEALPDDWRERLKKRKMNSTWCHPTSTKLIFYSPHSLLLLCQYTAVQFLMICKQSHAHVETFKVPDMIGHSSRGLECHFVFFLLFFR